MSQSDATCWTMIDGAAGGNESARAEFARSYEPVIRAYFTARWRSGPLSESLDDATQDVFVECYRSDGALSRVERDRQGGFRAFLYGVARNVARRFEDGFRRNREKQTADTIEQQMTGSDTRLSQVFDRAWATTIMRDAGRRMSVAAASAGPDAQKRVELLRLRFREEKPIRDIARMWDQDPANLHRQYAKARDEFRLSLMETLRFHDPSGSDRIEQECARLLALLA